MNEEQLVVSRAGRLGSIRLNRPKALNSINLDMVRRFSAALDDFVFDEDICAIFVAGEGERGLCAGGDIRRLYELGPGERHSFASFWKEEYELNARIASCPKPYIVVMDGLVMGGGVGISAHGRYRIATERSHIAMPETGIGFIPDVGASWLLGRAGALGLYMALSGAAANAGDAIRVGLADVMVETRRLPGLARRLEAIEDENEIGGLLAEAAMKPERGALELHEASIEAATAQKSVEDIIAAFGADASPFARQAVAEFARKPPTSLRLTHGLIGRGARAASLEACLLDEFRVACRLLDSHDLFEGIRAAIIDKDHKPLWRPASLAEVPWEAVAPMFEPSSLEEPAFKHWPAQRRS
ncbi:enoyl-CoA hydratase/isomerase family protein [Methylocystis heyeri]|uniref:3-hydroxyisobutyryl-CoA hydrolase n=1 Tax=Methylocystis heyeri TaxID=391905 RepID=A0A6B8KG02_9HYPH|nr:enoyl-CoA hydratase/isomerase family protein [Methylocystis heyeri]QGM47246.1 enoyl-CoA hydratase/isomerase family protein [Methylocystis heyeri]